MESQAVLYELVGRKPDAVMALEIGGGNGLQGQPLSLPLWKWSAKLITARIGLLLGASAHMNIPVVDVDWMGRAYP